MPEELLWEHEQGYRVAEEIFGDLATPRRAPFLIGRAAHAITGKQEDALVQAQDLRALAAGHPFHVETLWPGHLFDAIYNCRAEKRDRVLLENHTLRLVESYFRRVETRAYSDGFKLERGTAAAVIPQPVFDHTKGTASFHAKVVFSPRFMRADGTFGERNEETFRAEEFNAYEEDFQKPIGRLVNRAARELERADQKIYQAFVETRLQEVAPPGKGWSSFSEQQRWLVGVGLALPAASREKTYLTRLAELLQAKLQEAREQSQEHDQTRQERTADRDNELLQERSRHREK